MKTKCMCCATVLMLLICRDVQKKEKLFDCWTYEISWIPGIIRLIAQIDFERKELKNCYQKVINLIDLNSLFERSCSVGKACTDVIIVENMVGGFFFFANWIDFVLLLLVFCVVSKFAVYSILCIDSCVDIFCFPPPN